MDEMSERARQAIAELAPKSRELARSWLNERRNEYASVLDYALDFEQVLTLCAAYADHFARSERLRQMEEDCKAVCHFCAFGKGALFVDGKYFHRLGDDEGSGVVDCAAAAIRESMRKLEGGI
jgi:hypothetical protein